MHEELQGFLREASAWIQDMNAEKKSAVADSLIAMADRILKAAEPYWERTHRYYVPEANDPVAVAIMLRCRAADVESDATEDPAEKSRILRDAAREILRYRYYGSADKAPGDDDEDVCKCVCDSDSGGQ